MLHYFCRPESIWLFFFDLQLALLKDQIRHNKKKAKHLKNHRITNINQGNRQ